MNQKLILVVDDQEDNRIVFSTILTHHGYEVALAMNGRQGVEAAKSRLPDLILMDLQMPLVDGWEATRMLREDAATARIPIVAITAYDHHPAPRIQAAGFTAFLRKPIVPRGLVYAVELCLAAACDNPSWVHLPTLEPPSTPAM